MKNLHWALALWIGASFGGDLALAADDGAPVSLPTDHRDGVELTARLFRPAAAAPSPAVVALHGCGGLVNANGSLTKRHADWAARLMAAGYVVLFPDSFTARGINEICTIKAKDRPIRPQQRAGDALAAAAWLARQPFVDAGRLALIGWSHGGSSVLWTVQDGSPPAHDFKQAFAFYPGCRVPAERADWKARLPLTILIGDADDWTPPQPCRALATRGGIRLIEYPGAVHGFDAPDSPRRTRTDVGISLRGDGRVEVGTDPKARAAAIEEVMGTLDRTFGTR